MSAPRAKRFEYAAAVDRAGRVSAEGGAPVDLPEEWSPEALVLAGLARCVLASLRHHAHREGSDAAASASADGVVAKRDGDGRYAFVEVNCRVEAEIDPEPLAEELASLLAKAKRDCFISASLCVDPQFAWRVNGRDVRA